jgi:hypothetical protein
VTEAGLSSRARRFGLLALIATSGPIAFAIEWLFRTRFAPAEMREVYELTAPELTRFAWWCVPVPLLGLALGWVIHPSLERRALARIQKDPGPSARPPEERASLEAMFLATSIPQLLGLFLDFQFLMGADAAPVLATLPVSVGSVLVLGLFPPRATPR